jgi:hypothetical protein
MQRIIFTFLLVLISHFPALADQEGVFASFTAETSDKKYIFVMLNPENPSGWGNDKFSQSGMYLNDGSTTPLWAVDWLNRVFLPADGEHVVRRGKWTRYSATYEEEAFSFFHKDNLLKTYRTKDIVDFPWLLPHSSSHYRVTIADLYLNSPGDGVLMKVDRGEGYPLNSGVEIDNKNQTISTKTFHNDTYLFDLKTGNAISSTQPTRNTAIILFSILLIGYFFYVYSRSKNPLQKTRLNISNLVVGLVITFFLLIIPIISVSFNQIQDAAYSQYLPTFFDYAYLSIQMFPRYLLTTLKIINPPPENFCISFNSEENLKWLALFWFPCVLLFTFLDKVFILTLSKNYPILNKFT